jgi:hypothetical protein
MLSSRSSLADVEGQSGRSLSPPERPSPFALDKRRPVPADRRAHPWFSRAQILPGRRDSSQIRDVPGVLR